MTSPLIPGTRLPQSLLLILALPRPINDSKLNEYDRRMSVIFFELDVVFATKRLLTGRVAGQLTNLNDGRPVGEILFRADQ